jgi:hypothetical protein
VRAYHWVVCSHCPPRLPPGAPTPHAANARPAADNHSRKMQRGTRAPSGRPPASSCHHHAPFPPQTRNTASDTWPLKARVEAQAMGTPTFRPDSHTSIQHTHIQHADVAQDPPQPRREQGREPAHRHQGVCVHTEAQGHQTQLKGRQQVEPKKQVGGPLTQPPVQQQMKAAGRREVGG